MNGNSYDNSIATSYRSNGAELSNYNWILQYKISMKAKFKNEHIIYFILFRRVMGFEPLMVYIGEFGIIFLISSRPHQIIKYKFAREVEYLRKNISKPIYFVNYATTLEQVILSLFSDVRVHDMHCTIEGYLEGFEEEDHGVAIENPYTHKMEIERDLSTLHIGTKANPVSIFIHMDDRQIPIALGKGGQYIHLVNEFLKDWFGYYRIYVRS